MWDNIINKINKRMQSIASHLGVDSDLYNRYAALVDMALDYDYRADGTIKIKRNKSNLDPTVYQMQIYKQLLDMETYSEAKKKAKDILDEQSEYQDREYENGDFTDDDTEYTEDDLLRDMDYVNGHLQEALDIIYEHIVSGEGANSDDMALLDELQRPDKGTNKSSYRLLAYLIRRVIEAA